MEAERERGGRRDESVRNERKAKEEEKNGRKGRKRYTFHFHSHLFTFFAHVSNNYYGPSNMDDKLKMLTVEITNLQD